MDTTSINVDKIICMDLRRESPDSSWSWENPHIELVREKRWRRKVKKHFPGRYRYYDGWSNTYYTEDEISEAVRKKSGGKCILIRTIKHDHLVVYNKTSIKVFMTGGKYTLESMSYFDTYEAGLAYIKDIAERHPGKFEITNNTIT